MLKQYNTQFDYDLAFSRNLGWITEKEKSLVKAKRIAIAGLGGVGGIHLLTLVRLGFQNFNLADFDVFEIQNFNRQAGASLTTIGKTKLSVMIDLAKDINPDLDIKMFPDGVTADNAEEFLCGADLYLDGLDFFCLDIRELVFSKINDKKIPGVTVAPIGMGASLVNFLPYRMSFEEYFGFSKAKSNLEKALQFVIGLSPNRIQTKYLVDPSRMDFMNGKVASTPMGCQMCAAIAATEILKILLNRGSVICAPRSIQYDAYLNTARHTWIPWGYKNPMQLLRAYLGRKMFSGKKS